MRAHARDPPVEETLGEALRDRGETIATAESCTGGLAGSLLTDVPGSSDYFDRAYCTYSYAAKLDHGVSREALDDHGAVSEPVARQLAQRVRDAADATWGVSTTGIAGPSGGTEEKPVGTVFVGVAYAGEWGTNDTHTSVSRYEFDGDRRDVKEKIARSALRDVEAALE